MKNNKILFIGSFKQSKGGNFGGVHFASNSLRMQLADSAYEVIPLDITLNDINQVKVLNRLPSLALRQLKFIYLILRHCRSKFLLVFFSSGTSYLDKLPLLLIARCLRIRIISFPRSGFLPRDLKKSLYAFVVGRVFNMSHRIVCQSTYWRDTFAGLVADQQKLLVVENWVNEASLARSRNLSFPSYGDRPEVFRIAYVSRIEEAKGVFDVVEVAPLLAGKIRFEIDVYGSGSSLELVKAKIKQLNLNGVVTLKGWLSQEMMLEEINRHHLAIFPSRFEGYPNSLLDLIFAKVPVIAAGIPSVKAVGLDHISYYPPGDIGELADSILAVASQYSEAVKRVETLWNISLLRNSALISTPKLIKAME